MTLLTLLLLALPVHAGPRAVDSAQLERDCAEIVDAGPDAPGYRGALNRLVHTSRTTGSTAVIAETLTADHLDALNRDGRSWVALVLGRDAFDAGHAMEAGRLLQQVDPTDPLRPHALSMLGELAWNGDRDTALRHYRNVLRAHDDAVVPGLAPLAALQDDARAHIAGDSLTSEDSVASLDLP